MPLRSTHKQLSSLTPLAKFDLGFLILCVCEPCAILTHIYFLIMLSKKGFTAHTRAMAPFRKLIKFAHICRRAAPASEFPGN